MTTLVGIQRAEAAVHVFSPIVEEGEVETESMFERSIDRRSAKDDNASYDFSVGYGVTRYWATEIEAQWKHDPMSSGHFDSLSWENRFQLTPQGKYWADVGFFAEFERVFEAGDHDSVTLGPLIQKEWGRNLTTLNVLFNHEVGRGAAGAFHLDYRVQHLWRAAPLFQPGVELYGEPGKVGNFDKIDDQRIRLGPVAIGAVSFGDAGKLKYEIGYLVGVTGASERGTVRGLLEYELAF